MLISLCYQKITFINIINDHCFWYWNQQCCHNYVKNSYFSPFSQHVIFDIHIHIHIHIYIYEYDNNLTITIVMKHKVNLSGVNL